MTGKRLLIIFRQPPLGTSLAREAADVVLAAAAFEQQPTLLFLGDGIWQLLPQQEQAIERKSVSKVLSSFALYDVTDIYIDTEALAERQLRMDELAITGQPIDKQQLPELLSQFDTVLNF